jgi:hypothetical protein
LGEKKGGWEGGEEEELPRFYKFASRDLGHCVSFFLPLDIKKKLPSSFRLKKTPFT